MRSRTKASQCTGKKVFLTFEEARVSAREVRRYKEAAAEAYACRACGHFHVGTREIQRRRNRRRKAVRKARGRSTKR